MPIVVTFDIRGAQPIEHNRVQSLFERFGWENLGGSSYRYPKLGTVDRPVEDWLNHVVPALMLFRTYIIKTNKELRKFTIDVQSSAGINPDTGYGNLPSNDSTEILYPPRNQQFGESNLVNWLNSVDFPYSNE
jgi:hypothetical protein